MKTIFLIAALGISVGIVTNCYADNCPDPKKITYKDGSYRYKGWHYNDEGTKNTGKVKDFYHALFYGENDRVFCSYHTEKGSVTITDGKGYKIKSGLWQREELGSYECSSSNIMDCIFTPY